VTLGLQRRPGSAVELYNLRSYGAQADELADIATAIEPDGRIVIKIRIGDTQPAGTYHGILFDRESGLPCGNVSVKLF
jgi:hypothetical protein